MTRFRGWRGPSNAKRYEPRHFPYINLGRVYLTKGMIQKAIGSHRSLSINPDDSELAQLIEELNPSCSNGKAYFGPAIEV